MLTRRTLLLLFMSSAWLHPVQALAKDDSSGGGNSGSGNSGSGSSNSGSGSSNSGSGSDDDNDSDNDDNDNGGDDNDDGSDDDQDKARRAVERGEALELRKVLANVRRRYSGRIVSVRLKGRGSNLHYRIRVIDKDNRLLNLVVNARTGQVTAGSGQK